MLSAIVLTFNEATNIKRCLQSLSWCDEVLVVDSGSTDGTQALCEHLGVRVVYRAFDGFAQQRNFGIDQLDGRTTWVLHLDADEVVTEALAQRLQAIARSQKGGPKGYFIPSKLMLGERWLKHAGMYPVYQARFGRRQDLRFVMHGHGQRETLPATEMGYIDEPYLHYNFSKGTGDWFARHLRYARREAAERLAFRSEATSVRALWSGSRVSRRRALKALSYRLPGRPFWRFVYLLVGRLGILDGRAGIRYCLMLAVYEWWVDLETQALIHQHQDRTS